MKGLYLCSESKGADRLRGYWSAHLFSHYSKSRFSHAVIEDIDNELCLQLNGQTISVVCCPFPFGRVWNCTALLI